MQTQDPQAAYTRPEKLAKMTDEALLSLDFTPGSDAHYDQIMEICNRGLKDPEAGVTACSYLIELKNNLQKRPIRLGNAIPESPAPPLASGGGGGEALLSGAATGRDRFSVSAFYGVITGEQWETPTYWPAKTEAEAAAIKPNKGKKLTVMTAEQARFFQASKDENDRQREANTPLGKALARAEAAESRLKEEQEAAADLRSQVDGYAEWAADVKRLTRELDVALFGDEAAEQASLCDLVRPAAKLVADLRGKLAQEGEQERELLKRDEELRNKEREHWAHNEQYAERVGDALAKLQQSIASGSPGPRQIKAYFTKAYAALSLPISASLPTPEEGAGKEVEGECACEAPQFGSCPWCEVAQANNEKGSASE